MLYYLLSAFIMFLEAFSWNIPYIKMNGGGSASSSRRKITGVGKKGISPSYS